MNFRRRISKSRLVTAVSRDSFYVILFLCLVLLAATAVWVTKSNLEHFSQGDLPDVEEGIDGNSEIAGISAGAGSDIGSHDDPGSGTNNPAVLIEDARAEVGGMKDNGEKDDKENVGGQESAEQRAAEQKTAAAEDREIAEAVITTSASASEKTDVSTERMIMPVLGKICMDYGKDSLVYSKTLEQWTTHCGIDIAASIGTPVKSVKSGTVTEIANHSGLGIMITIDHGDGLITRYANLQNNNMVEEGQKVKQGKVISGVGNTAEFEIGDVPHLHFEVIKNGKHEDPKLYLPNM